MKKFRIILVGLFFVTNVAYGGGPCTPATSNGSCASATTLATGAACVTGTSCQGAAQMAGSCLFAGSECSWYSFVATSTDMFVNINVTATDGCNISSNVFNSGGTCGTLGAVISCQAGAPLSDYHSLTGLTIGNTYYVQACYPPGGPCGNSGVANWCINVGNTPPPCNVCTNPCGTASGYSTPPTVATVTANCTTTPFVPALAASSTHTFCYSFQATATSVDFNVIITSNCGAGNVVGLTWSAFNYPACGGAIQTGNLSNLTVTGLTVGNNYVFCYTFTVPATCTHTQHCPYFVGAVVLPIQLVSFNAVANERNIDLNWTTASELDNAYFIIDRSYDGINYEQIATEPSIGNHSINHTYSLTDINVRPTNMYYKLSQVSLNGDTSLLELKYINGSNLNKVEKMLLYPNPTNQNLTLEFNHDMASSTSYYEIMSMSGDVIKRESFIVENGLNNILVPTESLDEGSYVIRLITPASVFVEKFVKTSN